MRPQCLSCMVESFFTPWCEYIHILSEYIHSNCTVGLHKSVKVLDSLFVCKLYPNFKMHDLITHHIIFFNIPPQPWKYFEWIGLDLKLHLFHYIATSYKWWFYMTDRKQLLNLNDELIYFSFKYYTFISKTVIVHTDTQWSLLSGNNFTWHNIFFGDTSSSIMTSWLWS